MVAWHRNDIHTCEYSTLYLIEEFQALGLHLISRNGTKNREVLADGTRCMIVRVDRRRSRTLYTMLNILLSASLSYEELTSFSVPIINRFRGVLPQ